MTKIESLLQQVSKIVAREKTQQEERRKRGENFNIFNVLGVVINHQNADIVFLMQPLYSFS